MTEKISRQNFVSQILSGQAKNLTSIAILVAAIIIGGAIIYINPSFLKLGVTGGLTAQQAGEKAIKYINESLLRGAATASLLNTTEENGVYKLNFKIAETEYNSYVTKNGKVFFIEGINTESPLPTPSPSPENSENENSTPAPKTEKPDVKLFVMSYCPYGLQAEKAVLPAMDLLRNKAEIGVYFVNYIMHGKKELDENLKQYCIQKEENDKFTSYLSCFVKEGDSEKCSSQAQINNEKISACITATDNEFNISKQYNDQSTWLGGQYPKFGIYDSLNNQYGVKGSPTLVINGKAVEAGTRSPENFKKVICQAFNNPPQECSQSLSNTSTSPGFGEGTATSSGGGCGQ
ncbi:MAG: hypothetical protein COX90_01490 [Candidatus Nealsonbacteria bacterium CG_4_10_14_0_2_um_filter_38_17]|uniref:Thioredoxin-like fold domain-containing protein n=2 Tax=Candidatus Nealsoniibacteriota TaxID=1817911 RepID=A0A2M7UYH0_9BACT|nr:MAG: hypothetical protein COX36_01135 [Candidatus Nealsonbacteria bacterium CG23_combo_of_CG06-09_8_20_14_all_38_19]PIZ89024.1 MAG: hypothetical protein COX90_01490 [Candidatus Nealsonbacteria bacterium CG_4_10_14_0_2_um_filter_38_17]